jgi:hypothetical protein
MPRKYLLSFLSPLVLFALSACTLGSLSPEQLQATAQDMASTSIVLTLAAMPTNTVAPSATVQPSATATLEPTLTPSQATTETSSPYPTSQVTATSYGQLSGSDFDEAQDNKTDQNAPLGLVNNSGEDIRFILLSPIYGEYEFSGNMTLILPEGQYTYRAWIGNKGPFSGSFSITNGDKHVLTFHSDKIHFATP